MFHKLNMKPQYLFILLALALLTSCFPKMYWTDSGGVRFEKPRTYWLKYKRQKFDNGQRIKICHEKIYETTKYSVNDSSLSYKMIARFFPEGQVLFFIEGQPETPFENQINDSLAGIPGYYAVKGDKLKFQRWTNIFGDQTPETYGVILNDSTLKIYNTYVPDCTGPFNAGITIYECLEAKQDFSIWKKTDKYQLKQYNPSW